MCTGAEIASIAGTAASVASQQGAASAKSREAEQATRTQRMANERAGQRVNEEVHSLKDNTSDQDQRQAQQDYMQALRTARLTGEGGMSDGEYGAASDAFRDDSAASRVANVSGNRDAAANMAKIDAPFMQRVRESAGASRTASDLSRIENQAQGDQFLSQLRMSMIQPNALLSGAGEFTSGWADARSKRALPAKPTGYSGPPRTADSTIPGSG